MGYKLSVDVGGTFTDVVLFHEEDGQVITTKTSSTPGDYSRGIATGIEKICKKAGVDTRSISSFIHGTTVATNTLLERKGAKTALITTKGFRDILEIARQKRPDIYDFAACRPEPVVPRYMVFEIDERTLSDGTIQKTIDADEAAGLIRKLKEAGVEAVSVGLINSYINQTNEHILGEMVRAAIPDAAVCVSSEILPEIGEYERICTASVNAYLMPRVQGYVQRLEEKRAAMGIPVPVKIMQSNGGIMSAEAAGERTVHTVFSGPVGGALAAARMAELIGEKNIVTIDIGGTSSDLALIKDYTVNFSQEGSLGGFPVRVPMVEMHTIGAGGGSIAAIDIGGGLRVGPRSAGAYPGPACYGNGDDPTVTDANLVLGYLNPDNFLGGEMSLDRSASERAIDTRIAGAMNIPMLRAADGIFELANANMCGGIKVVSTSQGYDLREFSLMAFGGGGSLHAAALADALDMKRVIVPTNPGMFSAIGCQLAPVKYDYMRTVMRSQDQLSNERWNEAFRQMAGEALRDMAGEGYGAEDVRLIPTADIRYQGQLWSLPIPVKMTLDSGESVHMFAEQFEASHERTYGYRLEDNIFVVALRLSAVATIQGLDFKKGEAARAGCDPKKGVRMVRFGGQEYETAVYDRDAMAAGTVIEGPAMVEEYAASTPVPPGYIVRVDEYLNMLIERKEKR